MPPARVTRRTWRSASGRRFDFFYTALPGYEKVGQRRILLGCWGAFHNPDACDYEYRHMADWGRKMFVTPGIVIDGRLHTTKLIDINLGIRILPKDGYELLWRIRALEAGTGRTPAVAVTAYARDGDKARALDAGFDGHVAKPMSANELLSVVERLMGIPSS